VEFWYKYLTVLAKTDFKGFKNCAFLKKVSGNSSRDKFICPTKKTFCAFLTNTSGNPGRSGIRCHLADSLISSSSSQNGNGREIEPQQNLMNPGVHKVKYRVS